MKRQTILAKALACFIFAIVLTIGGVLSSCDNKKAGAGKDSDSGVFMDTKDEVAVPPSDSSKTTDEELSDLKEEVMKKKAEKDLSELETEVSKKKSEKELTN